MARSAKEFLIGNLYFTTNGSKKSYIQLMGNTFVYRVTRLTDCRCLCC